MRLPKFLCLLSFLGCCSAAEMELVNNHPFPVRMPILVEMPLTDGRVQTAEGEALQRVGRQVALVADLPPSGRRDIRVVAADGRSFPGRFSMQPGKAGVDLMLDSTSLGALTWDVVLKPAPPREAGQGEPVVDFAAIFTALPLVFDRVEEGPVFDRWEGQASKDGLELTVSLQAFHAGFLDLDIRLTNISAPTQQVYCAVVCRWDQPEVVARSLCYDNRREPFPDGSYSLFRRGEERHLFVQRGVDWIHSRFGTDVSVGWLNAFASSFTVHQQPVGKSPGRWVGANIPQLGQEAQAAKGRLFSVTEIARSNIRSYLSRLEDRVLPPSGEGIVFSSRLVFASENTTDEQIDHAFVAYAGFTANREVRPGKTAFEFGVPYVRFGTSYSPYSTLGENFIHWKMPGLDRDGFWPLAADTVLGWRLFADQIRRDLRIAKTMGYELVRLHHLELIEKLDQGVQREYLDFLFEQFRHLGLKALLDVKLPPERVRSLVSRYRELLEGVEIDNEVLIFGIPDDQPDYWNEVYKQVKQAAPEVPVHLTGHTNTGAFDRLKKLNVQFDRVGAHAYADSVEAIPSVRGFALAVAGYAARVGKPPVITEWNWRGLTRMSPEARALVFAPIFENVLKTRSVPVLYQFQFQETLAVNPAARKGFRHYENLWLSRRPKPEALEMMKLISTYSSSTSPNRLVELQNVEIESKEPVGTVDFTVTNRGPARLTFRLSAESDKDVSVRLDCSRSLSLEPGQSRVVPMRFRVGSEPGFYHLFLRVESGQMVRYGWARVLRPGQPRRDRDQNSRVRFSQKVDAFDLNRPAVVIYGEDAPILELEAASVVANTLEAATGRPVGLYHLANLPVDLAQGSALILVGTKASHQLIAARYPCLSAEEQEANAFVNAQKGGRELIISGITSEGVAEAAMDWVLSYWRFARDAGVLRVPLVKSELPAGGDATLLP